jgi:predicted N-acetyltransferase YhbS
MMTLSPSDASPSLVNPLVKDAKEPSPPSSANPMATFTIRKATEADNEKLIELARRCPMKGLLEIYTDRYPDFFATNRVQGDYAHIYVAEAPDGAIVGCGAFTERRERRGDKDVTVLHVGDLRSDPAQRRGRIAAQLIHTYLEMLRTGRYDHGVVEILEGNQGGGALNRLLTEEIALVPEGRMNFYQLVPFRTYRLSKAYHYRRATRDDMPAIISMFEACYADAPVAPHFTVSWLEEQLAKDPSFSLNDLWVAADAQNQALAMIGLWDQSSFRRTVVTKFSRGVRSAVRFLSMLGLVWKLPPVPRESQALSYVFGRWPVAKPQNIDALANLSRFLINRVYQNRKHQFLSIGFHERDPLAKSLDGITKVQERMEIFSHWLRDSEGYQDILKNPEGKRFIELSLI